MKINKELWGIKTEQKSEAKKREIPVPQESPEILIRQAEAAVANLQRSGDQKFNEQAARAATEGLRVDNQDKDALDALRQDAISAEQKLAAEFSESPPKIAEINDNNVKQTDLDKKDTRFRDPSTDISNVFVSVLENKLNVENIFTEIDKIQQNIDSLQENSIKKIFNHFKIKKLAAERSTKEEQVSALMQDIASAEHLLSELYGQIDEKHQAKSIMQYAKDHFRNDPERMDQINKLENERKKRSVESAMMRNNTFIFHGIRDEKSGPVGSRASNLKQETPQDIRIKIALALEPSLSTSSFKNDGAKQGLWSNTGLLLRSGHIDAAKSWDMHTNIEGVNNRGNLAITTASDIDRVMQEKRVLSGGVVWYNEIVVRNPKYAGLCVGSLELNADLARLAEELKLPVFFHDGKGQVYETSPEPGSKSKLVQGKEVFPSDIANSEYDIPQQERRDLIKEVVRDDIFHIDERIKDAQKL